MPGDILGRHDGEERIERCVMVSSGEKSGMLLRLLQCTRQHSCPQQIIIWLSVNSAEVEKPCSKDKYTQNEKSQISLQNYK